MNYAKAIRICRAAFGIRQAELAERLRIGPSHLSLIESGKRQPSLETLDDIARALGVPKPLLILLASEPKDIDDTNDHDLDRLSRALLNILVGASDNQRTLPFRKKKDNGYSDSNSK